MGPVCAEEAGNTGHFGFSNAPQTHWPPQKSQVKPFLHLAWMMHLCVKSVSDTILENLSQCPSVALGLTCQNWFRKMLKVESNNSLLTDITVHWGSVHTYDGVQHCCTNFDKFQSHCSSQDWTGPHLSG